ncbi:MFS transporter [Nonomuraea longicatena]|uniref:Major facilitator superfamily (MFS) profile domain-containing protein n=1 Tax=Nonomuraea longicatena TaxID=83682 RepID=A0ABN1P181_9ACTN
MNPRARYSLVSFLTWLPAGLTTAPMVLLMAERGLSVAEIGVVWTVYSVVTIALELPTGGLSDVVGRRRVLAASAAVTVVAMVLVALSTSMWMFVLASALKGVARALSSGPAQAWYVDTVHALDGPDADLRPGLAAGGAMGSVALCVGVLAGGVLPLAVPESLIEPLAAPPLLAALAAAVLLGVVLAALPEPPHVVARSFGEVLREVPRTVRSGVRLVAASLLLRRIMLYTVVFGMALTTIELLTPLRLADLAGTAELGATAYALVAALGFAGSAAGSALAPALARLLRGNAGAMVTGVVAGALSLYALAATTGLDGPAGLAAAAAAYVLMFAGLGAVDLLGQALTHGEVTAQERATVTSVTSLSLQGGGVLANMAAGALATAYGVAVPWTVVAGLTLLSALLFVRLPVRRPETRPHGTLAQNKVL